MSTCATWTSPLSCRSSVSTGPGRMSRLEVWMAKATGCPSSGRSACPPRPTWSETPGPTPHTCRGPGRLAPNNQGPACLRPDLGGIRVSVVVIGLQHKQAPLSLLEAVAVGDADLHKVLGALSHRRNLQETVVLSTCLRTEVYSVVDRFHDAVAEVYEVLAEHSGVSTDELA